MVDSPDLPVDSSARNSARARCRWTQTVASLTPVSAAISSPDSSFELEEDEHAPVLLGEAIEDAVDGLALMRLQLLDGRRTGR